MKAEILSILRSSKDYVSGQEICNRLGVSRTAVWKAIGQLKEEGYQFEAISNKGYRLIATPDVITPWEIKSQLNTKIFGKRIEFYDKVESTNSTAKEFAQNTGEDGLLVICEQQEAGRGRRGRKWESQGGTGIWMSLLLRPKILPSNASMLTLVAALAVAKAIDEEQGLDVLIKWPNDIVIHNKKVCGILTEMSCEMDYVHYVVVGIGINANIESFSPDLEDKATSLYLEGGKRILRSKLIAMILKYMELYYEKFLVTRDLSAFLDEYNHRLVNMDKEIRVLEPLHEFEAISRGINEQGELLAQLPNGQMKEIRSGEVSVRGLYGYV